MNIGYSGNEYRCMPILMLIKIFETYDKINGISKETEEKYIPDLT